jgi:hypothetical protein
LLAEADLAEMRRALQTPAGPTGRRSTTHALPNFVTQINGLDLPFIHVRSRQRESAAAYRHWSGSIIEQLKL